MEKLSIKGMIIGLSLLIPLLVNAQSIQPTVWSIRFSRENIDRNDTVTMYFIGQIPENLGVYATKYRCDYGPMPTKIVFINENNSYEVIDSAISVGDSVVFDPIFECTLRKFKHQAIIKQVIKVKEPDFEIQGQLEYQSCTEDMCLQYRINFEAKGTKVIKVENTK